MFDPISSALHPPRVARTRRVPIPRPRREPAQPFTWPLRRLGTREPEVLATPPGARCGVQLGYAPEPYDRELFVPVYAANLGEVSCALPGPTGYAVSVDHDGTWSTHYVGLSQLFVIPCAARLRRRERVRAGQVIGYAAKAPIRIGFELWQWSEQRGFVAVDPVPHMATWTGAPAHAIPLQEAA